jgi:Protein of unknown function (DUF2510)
MSVQHLHSGPAATAGPPRTPPLPGWYPDPGDPHRLRLWDGQLWTEYVTPMPVSLGTVPIAVHERRPGHRIGGIGPVALGMGPALLVLLLVALVAWSRAGEDEPPAMAACRAIVTERLAVPDSAVFGKLHAREGVAERWSVTGAVDSLSAGGTVERTTFSCTVSPDDGRWRLDRLRFNAP